MASGAGGAGGGGQGVRQVLSSSPSVGGMWSDIVEAQVAGEQVREVQVEVQVVEVVEVQVGSQGFQTP